MFYDIIIIIDLIVLALIVIGLLVAFIIWLRNNYIYKDVVKHPEKYNIIPGITITIPYELYESGYHNDFKIYIKDINKETKTVSYTTNKWAELGNFDSETSILEFYQLYIEGKT